MSKEIDIKDYLHLYLGCDVMHEDGTTATMVSVDRFTAGFIHHDHQMYGEQNKDNWKNKLILRPTSDITNEERGERGRTLLTYSKTFIEAEYVRWMISKGFDMFGLIDAGLAIDKTKIKHPESKTHEG